MKKNINKIYQLFIMAAFLSIMVSSCEETWDEHYGQEETDNKELLLTGIEAASDLSTFVDLLYQVGYDSLLLYSQAYTVFAPVNDAFSDVSSDVLNDPEQLKALLGNHICKYSYSSIDAKAKAKMKMINGKYVTISSQGEQCYFDGYEMTSVDNLCKNGIFHKIDAVAMVKPNIWDYLQESTAFPNTLAYLSPYNSLAFDEINSIAIGKNTLGETVYDSVFVASNTYFDIIGDLSSEEDLYTFLGLPESVYQSVYQSIENYFQNPDATKVEANVNKTIIDNLVFPIVAPDELTDSKLLTTTGNNVLIQQAAVAEAIDLSNGYVFILNDLNLDPVDIFYKPTRFELENTVGRKIGKTSDLSIIKQYDTSASGNFNNKVMLLNDPDSNNDYFEVSFSNVHSAKYDIYIKFSPIGATKPTKLKYVLSYSEMDGSTTSVEIEGGVIGNDEEGRVKIGDTYDIPVYVDSPTDSNYFVKLKVAIDVSNAELILYDRSVGIDYIELVPVP